MAIIREADVASETFNGGALYRTLVGDADGTTPIRVGVQTSPPGYRTPIHSHPYMEVIVVLDGEGEAWIEGMAGPEPIGPGVTLRLEPGVRHWFGTRGEKPLRIVGIHANPTRIVDVHGRVG